jgi:hypothetical protein
VHRHVARLARHVPRVQVPRPAAEGWWEEREARPPVDARTGAVAAGVASSWLLVVWRCAYLHRC